MKNGIKLFGEDSYGKINTKIVYNKKTKKIKCDFKRVIDRGTNLVFEANWRETKTYIQNCYMDNRLGVWNCLEVSKTLENYVPQSLIVKILWTIGISAILLYIYHKVVRPLQSVRFG